MGEVAFSILCLFFYLASCPRNLCFLPSSFPLEFERVLPFQNSCVNGCCALGHNDGCQEGEGDDLSVFGLDFQAEGKRYSDDFCLSDSDGDTYANGDELGDPCCLWNYYEQQGRPEDLSGVFFRNDRSHPAWSHDYLLNRLSCAAPFEQNPVDLSKVTIYRLPEAENRLKVSWEGAALPSVIGGPLPCLCRMRIQTTSPSGAGSTLLVPWGQQYAVLPSGVSSIRLVAMNAMEDESNPSNSIQVSPTAPTLNDTLPLTLNSVAGRPVADAPATGKVLSNSMGALIGLLGCGLTILVMSRLLTRFMPITEGYRILPAPYPSVKGLLTMAIIGGFLALAFYIDYHSGHYDPRFRAGYAASSGAMLAAMLTYLTALRPVAQYITGAGWERIAFYHGFLSLVLLAFIIWHGYYLVDTAGFQATEGNGWLERDGLASTVCFFSAPFLAALHHYFPKVITYDVFRTAHYLLWPLPIILVSNHASKGPGAAVEIITLIVIGVMIGVQTLISVMRHWCNPNFAIISLRKVGDNIAVMTLAPTKLKDHPRAKKEGLFRPGQWASIRPKPPMRFDANPFTIVPSQAIHWPYTPGYEQSIYEDKVPTMTILLYRAGGTFTRYLIDALATDTGDLSTAISLEVDTLCPTGLPRPSGNVDGLACSVMGPYGGFSFPLLPFMRKPKGGMFDDMQCLPPPLRHCDVIIFIVGGSGVTPALSLAPVARRSGKSTYFLWSFRDFDILDLVGRWVVSECASTPEHARFHCSLARDGKDARRRSRANPDYAGQPGLNAFSRGGLGRATSVPIPTGDVDFLSKSARRDADGIKKLEPVTELQAALQSIMEEEGPQEVFRRELSVIDGRLLSRSSVGGRVMNPVIVEDGEDFKHEPDFTDKVEEATLSNNAVAVDSEDVKVDLKSEGCEKQPLAQPSGPRTTQRLSLWASTREPARVMSFPVGELRTKSGEKLGFVNGPDVLDRCGSIKYKCLSQLLALPEDEEVPLKSGGLEAAGKPAQFSMDKLGGRTFSVPGESFSRNLVPTSKAAELPDQAKKELKLSEAHYLLKDEFNVRGKRPNIVEFVGEVQAATSESEKSIGMGEEGEREPWRGCSAVVCLFSGLFVCGPGPMYWDAHKAVRKHKKVKTVHYEVFKFVP